MPTKIQGSKKLVRIRKPSEETRTTYNIIFALLCRESNCNVISDNIDVSPKNIDMSFHFPIILDIELLNTPKERNDGSNAIRIISNKATISPEIKIAEYT